MPLLLTSCTKEKSINSDEYVQINFSARLPQASGTRATASSLTVNKVVCAVFENQIEVSSLRKIITIEDEQNIVFAPNLIKGRTYDVVFWAMKDDNYDVDDMTAITRASVATATESDFDAFTESVKVEVTGSKSETITLKRPLAQLNIGVTQDDWNAVVNNFNMTPTTIALTLNGKSVFNALTGKAIGEDAQITYNLACTGSELAVNNITYKSIASCYVLPEAQKETFDITITVMDANSSEIRSNVNITSIPLQSNYKTHVVGSLLTGTMTYKISIKEGFEDIDKIEDIDNR